MAYVVKMWEKTPLGRKALQTAEERAEKFLERNKYGLYRGEVLLDIGTAHLVSNFDLENGEKWLTRAAEWFDSARQFDKDLQSFELPEQVRRASTPPKNERFKDRWENVRLSQPKPGDLFNRRTCEWYWNAKRKEVTVLQGLVAFAKEDHETAEKHWNLLSELDKEFYAQQQAAGWGDATTYSRLIWSLKNKKSSLYARPEEMSEFKIPKRRLAVLIGDCFYMSEKPMVAMSIFQRLEAKELGQMSKNETAYVTVAIFNCMCWDGRLDEIAYLESKLKHFVGTPSESRAVLGYANRLKMPHGFGVHPKTFEAYDYLIKKFPGTDDAEYADVSKGLLYLCQAEQAGYDKNIVAIQANLGAAWNHYCASLDRVRSEDYRSEIKKHLKQIGPRIGKNVNGIN